MIFATQVSGLKKSPVRIVGEKSSVLGMVRGRLFILGAFFALAYAGLAARAVDLTIVKRSPEKTSVIFAIPGSIQQADAAPRADIYDRNGALLATTLKTASLYADPYLISDIPKTARGLAAIFPEFSSGEILNRLQRPDKKRFVWLKKNLTPQEQYEVTKLGEPGLAFVFEDRRIYPQGKLMSHIVGFTDLDNQGLSGMERGFDETLLNGESLSLTIDVRLQHIMRREVKKAIRDFNAKAGVGILMDVRTGEVLAGVSLPDFDPQTAGKADKEEIFNRMTLGTYELGSVIKIFSTAAFLETHDVPMSASFDARTPIKQGRFVINDYHAENRVLTIPEIFMYSSNIGSAMMGQAVGTQALKGFYAKAGLLEPLHFEFPEVAKPQVPSPWREVNTLTAAYGHGFATTPLQFTAAAAGVVNGGIKVRPRLVMKKENNSERPERIVSEETSRKMRELLRLVVTDGTGKNAEVAGYEVGGKTGTAEKIGAAGYDSTRLISSFLGVFPIDNPRYAVFVLIDEPKGNEASHGYATAGWVSAPAVSRIILAAAAILGIPPETMIEREKFNNPLRQYISVKTP